MEIGRRDFLKTAAAIAAATAVPEWSPAAEAAGGKGAEEMIGVQVGGGLFVGEGGGGGLGILQRKGGGKTVFFGAIKDGRGGGGWIGGGGGGGGGGYCGGEGGREHVVYCDIYAWKGDRREAGAGAAAAGSWQAGV